MYTPCTDCSNRRGSAYTKDCDHTCSYANAVKYRDDLIKELEKKLEQAYCLIGEVMDKPNPFETIYDIHRLHALAVLKDLSKDMYPSYDLFGNKTLVINRDKFEVIRKKYLDKENSNERNCNQED